MKHLVIILVGLFLMGCEGEELLKSETRLAQDLTVGLLYENGTSTRCDMHPGGCMFYIGQESKFISITFTNDGYIVDFRDISPKNPPFHTMTGYFKHNLQIEQGFIESFQGSFGPMGELEVDVLIDTVEISIDDSILDIKNNL